MSYLVLSRKYRPQNFQTVVGQTHITDILKKAIESDRIAHAYLFCGPRGIGKTSCARILAKSLNCEKGPTINPCGKCSSCLEIAKSSSFDVLEIDGASNRGIDEIRDLRENVKFAPSYGRYKIYIVDEVHMLTTEAFNALLKTLEEPPAHVKFIFATTAANKVPATIISRCQKFDFKRIAIKDMVAALESICKKEKLKVDQNALYAIGKSAQGSLRDALSVLDQLSSLNDREIFSEDVCSMLGLVELDLIFSLADALGRKDCKQALQILDDIIDKGKDASQFIRDLIEHFRNLMIIKVGGKSMGRLVDYPVAIKDKYLEQCSCFSMPMILKTIENFIDAQEKARIIESVKMALEIAIAKMCLTPQLETGVSSQENFPQKEKSYKFSATTALKNNKGQIDISGNAFHEKESANNNFVPEPSIVPEEPDSLEAMETVGFGEGEVTLNKIIHLWEKITHLISRQKMSVATFLQSGFPQSYEEDKLTIGFPLECTFQKSFLESEENIKLVEEVLFEKLKSKILVSYCLSQDHAPQAEDPTVQNVLDVFGGEVIHRWHEE